ncbi:MAG TPA: four helix bundle protein [Abditibacteriaceae bacterium]|jgi:four helix bundle protein
MARFQDLQVWQRAKDLAVSIYQLTNEGAFNRDFGLRDQARRAAVSIASNIAEGHDRGTNKDSVRFFYMAKGSAAELRTQLIIAKEIAYLKEDEHSALGEQCDAISRMLGSLIKVRSANL